MVKFARGAKHFQAQQFEKYKENCQKHFELQNRYEDISVIGREISDCFPEFSRVQMNNRRMMSCPTITMNSMK